MGKVATENTLRECADALAMIAGKSTVSSRVRSLSQGTDLAAGNVVDAVGVPQYYGSDEIAALNAYGVTETGWYVLARVEAPNGISVENGFAVTGADGFIAPPIGSNHVDIAVNFGVAAESKVITINWGSIAEKIVLRATDLAVRNLDSRATYYVYDIGEFATYTWKLTTDANFVAKTRYYTKDGDKYTLADVVVGEAVPADTYYVHASVTFEGMPRNLSYMMDLIDCPVTIVMPIIEDDNYGAWFEIQARYSAAYSVTLRVPEGVRMSANGTQTTAVGVNIMTVQYFGTDKMWRLDNTKWAEPT